MGKSTDRRKNCLRLYSVGGIHSGGTPCQTSYTYNKYPVIGLELKSSRWNKVKKKIHRNDRLRFDNPPYRFDASLPLV